MAFDRPSLLKDECWDLLSLRSVFQTIEIHRLLKDSSDDLRRGFPQCSGGADRACQRGAQCPGANVPSHKCTF